MWERTGESEYFVLIRRIAIVVLIILLGFSVYLASAQSPNDSKLPMPFGIGVAVLLSSSL